MNADDPNLTAYALGELNGEAQAAAAQDLGGSPELSAEAWEIRAFGSRLQKELQAEPAPRMRPEQRARVLAEVDRAAAIIEAERTWWRGWVPAAIAASAAMMIGGSLFVQNQQFAQWWAKRTHWEINLLWADDSSSKGADSMLPPVDPSIQDRPIYRIAPATPELPPPDRLALPPPPAKNTARLTQPPPLDTPKSQPAISVDPSTIPMNGKLRITARSERVRSKMGASVPAASPTPGPAKGSKPAEAR